MGDKFEFKRGEEIFISYLDDSGINKSGYFYFIKLENSALIFKTKEGNILLLPIIRILKVKSKGGYDEK